jgi:hypothetical protein
MKTKYLEKIGDYTIVRFINNAAVDPEKTKSKIKSMITPEMTEIDIEKLYMENIVYAEVGAGAENIEEEIAEQVQRKLDERGENLQLLDNGEYIADYRGTEYWIKNSDKWGKEKIEEIGVDLPERAILQDDITAEQQAEISLQQEEERIAALTPEEKIKEKSDKLHAIAREVIMKAEEAELLGEVFDKTGCLHLKKADIEKIYN